MLEQPIRDHDIAVIATAGRFPGANSVAELWMNLDNGVESFSPITDEDLAGTRFHGFLAQDPHYVRVRPVLDDIRGFDARFFGMSPREAAVSDPQHRVFLECVQVALEQSGYGRAGQRGRVGLFAGDNLSTYLHTLVGDGDTHLRLDPFEMVIGNDKDGLTTAVSYRLDLTGPAVSVQTFCSTSAVAIHMACQSLRAGESDMALAGGVCIQVPDRVGYLYTEGGQVSPDGHIRTFDAKGQGGIFGDGAGVVLLKPLKQAIIDRDTVLAVIRGSAMNNDGSSKFSYTAPSVVGQATAVAAALRDADVAPADISYVEAHGTATELGDPIEVAALTRAFRDAEVARSGQELQDRQYCAIGSVKTNVGHLDRAASVTGFIKVVEALAHEVIPQSLHYETPNPEIDFAHSPFYVAGTKIAWPRQSGRPRIAGVNGLGMGGTNVHIVLQEPPRPQPRPASLRRWQVLPVSGMTEKAATDYLALMATHFGTERGQDLGDVSYTLQTGRTDLPHRRVVIADSAESAAGAFAAQPAGGAALLARHDHVKGRRTTFLLAGVGEQYAGMVADLYRTEPTFRLHLDEGQRLLSQHSDIDAVTPLTARRPARGTNRDLVAALGRRPAPTTGGPLSDTRIAQPAVFLAEYALARTLTDWGAVPDMLLGYSLGEYVAACLAGVLDLSDAIRLVAHRADLISGLPAGAMLAVPRSWEELAAIVPDLAERGIDLAALTPGQTVVGGPVQAVRDLADLLSGRRISSRRLDTTHAFHTRMLRPVAEQLTAWVATNVTLNAPQSPYVSNVTGELATTELVTDPAYWAEHMCSPVRFTAGLGTALAKAANAVVEIGPGKSLGAMARAHQDCDRSRWPLVLATMPGADEEGTTGDRALAGALGELWLVGADLDWDAYHRLDQGRPPGRVPLPTYPFQRQDFWFDAATMAGEPIPGNETSSGDDLVSAYEKHPLLPESQWLNLGVWRERTPRPPMAEPGDHWVLFTDAGAADDIAGALTDSLAGSVRRIIRVRPGEAFTDGQDGYRIRPGNIEDTLELFTRLKQDGVTPDRVVHLWTLTEAETDRTVRLGMQTLVAVARAAHEVGFGEWKIDVVTAGTLQVSGDEPVVPARATAHGPMTILPVEYPGSAIRVLDLVHGAAPPVAQVVAELRTDPANEVVALRGRRRWTPDFEVLALAADGQPAPEPPARFRDGGVYLITGGLGGIGLALAERLAEDHKARLVLMGRTPVPPPEQWEAVLGDPAATGEVRRRIEGLRGLAARGVEFEVVTGDIAVLEDVRRTVATARARFGEINGVLHAAGVPGMGMMQFKTVDDMERVLAPKVAGTVNLAEVLADEPALDLMVLFSSVAAWTGALGQADYSAANSFLDSFARSGALPQARVVSIGWGEWTWNGWTDGLDGYEPVLREFYVRHRETFGIDFDAGWRCLRQVLGRDEPHVVVNTQDFAASVAGSRSYTIEDIQAGARQGRGDQRFERPELSTPYIEPSNGTEAAVAEIWGEWLGIDHVGVMDNFFDLGGNSLVGVGVIDAVRRALELDHLAPHVLYQAPTVQALAAAATTSTSASAGEPAAQDTGSSGRAGRRQQRLARRRMNAGEGTRDE